MASRIPDAVSLEWFMKNRNGLVRNLMRYADQHKGAQIVSPTGKIAPGIYSHESKMVLYDLRDTETSAVPLPIAAPVLSVTEDDPNQELDVSWTLPEPYDALYLERSLDGIAFEPLATIAGTATTYDDAAVTPETTYHYRIRGQVGGAYSAYSNIDSGELQVAAGFALLGCGFNDDYQLGDGTTVEKTTFTDLDPGETYLKVAGSGFGSAFLRGDGTIWACGQNGRGQTGDGTTTGPRQTPVQTGSDDDWTDLLAGRDFYFAKKADGKWWGWGANSGQFGVGDFIDKDAGPVEIPGSIDFAQVALGYFHAVIRKTDGTIWACGDNLAGELGQGNSGGGTELDVFTQIGSDADWVWVGTGESFTFAIKTDGTLWFCGRNNVGQAGKGDTSSATTLVQVGALTTWAKVTGGADFAIAIKTDKTLWATGEGSSGQLGQNSTTDSTSWVQVGVATDWERVECGDLHWLAMKTPVGTPGALYGCGYNGDGGLGLGDLTDRKVITQIGGDSDWNEFSAGEFHSLATKG